jgi:hypothetical protein
LLEKHCPSNNRANDRGTLGAMASIRRAAPIKTARRRLTAFAYSQPPPGSARPALNGPRLRSKGAVRCIVLFVFIK